MESDCKYVKYFLQEFLQQIRERQTEVSHLNEGVGKLTDGQVCPALEEIRRLRRSWMDLGQRAEELEAQRGEDMQRSGEYQEIVVAVEELFHQVSREWDYLARYQAFLDSFIFHFLIHQVNMITIFLLLSCFYGLYILTHVGVHLGLTRRAQVSI